MMARALTGAVLLRIGPERLAEIRRAVAVAQLAADETESQVGGEACLDLCADVSRVFETALAHSADIQRAVQVVAYAGVCLGYAIAQEERRRGRRLSRELVSV